MNIEIVIKIHNGTYVIFFNCRPTAFNECVVPNICQSLVSLLINFRGGWFRSNPASNWWSTRGSSYMRTQMDVKHPLPFGRWPLPSPFRKKYTFPSASLSSCWLYEPLMRNIVYDAYVYFYGVIFGHFNIITCPTFTPLKASIENSQTEKVICTIVADKSIC